MAQNQPSSGNRILAVNPGMQYLSTALFDGETIVRYGIKTFPGRKALPYLRKEVEQYLTKLVDTYQPERLALKEPFYAPSLSSQNLRTLTADIKTWAKWKRLEVFTAVPPTIKAFFCRDQKTNQSLAEAMVSKYPFLAQYLSPLSWKRRYWFHVFDAVGLGLMCQQKLARRHVSL